MAERPAPCPRWAPDITALVMAQIDPSSEAALVQHMEGCAGCRAEHRSLLDIAAATLAVDIGGPVVRPGPDLVAHDRLETGHSPSLEGPSPDLGERVEAAVAAERRRAWLARAGLAAVAAAAAAVVAAVLLVGGDGDGPGRLEGEPVAFTLVPEGATASAVIADDEGDGSLVQLTASGLDPDTTYALWLSPPGGDWDDRVAGGTFRPDHDGTVDVRLRCALPVDQYGRVWVTTPAGAIALDTE